MAETVVVACKLNNGFIMELPGKPRVFINGPAVEIGLSSQRRTVREVPHPSLITPNGYALTYDVDAEFWKAWSAAYAQAEFVKKKFVYAMTKSQDARALARELSDEKTGLEPVDPDKMGDGLERVTAAA